MKEFFHRNATPARVEINDDDEEVKEVHIPKRSASNNQAPPAAPVLMNPPADSYLQLIETMRNMQALQQPAKIVVKSRDHKEFINITKLQNGMLRCMRAWKLTGTMAPPRTFALPHSLKVF
jgi:hypothetical protein